MQRTVGVQHGFDYNKDLSKRMSGNLWNLKTGKGLFTSEITHYTHMTLIYDWNELNWIDESHCQSHNHTDNESEFAIRFFFAYQIWTTKINLNRK